MNVKIDEHFVILFMLKDDSDQTVDTKVMNH